MGYIEACYEAIVTSCLDVGRRLFTQYRVAVNQVCLINFDVMCEKQHRRIGV